MKKKNTTLPIQIFLLFFLFLSGNLYNMYTMVAISGFFSVNNDHCSKTQWRLESQVVSHVHVDEFQCSVSNGHCCFLGIPLAPSVIWCHRSKEGQKDGERKVQGGGISLWACLWCRATNASQSLAGPTQLCGRRLHTSCGWHKRKMNRSKKFLNGNWLPIFRRKKMGKKNQKVWEKKAFFTGPHKTMSSIAMLLWKRAQPLGESKAWSDLHATPPSPKQKSRPICQRQNNQTYMPMPPPPHHPPVEN